MPEEQAFSVLVKIMFNYGHRDMFKPGFELLHCMLFQLDKLLEVSKIQNLAIYIIHNYVHLCNGNAYSQISLL